MINEQLTPNFSLRELTRSEFGERRDWLNIPTPEALANLRKTAEGLERIRALAGRPIVVQSGYRMPALNGAIGGAPNSQHVIGQAADINAVGLSPRALAELIRGAITQLGVDQLILESPDNCGWVHVSFAPKPRGQVLTKLRGRPYLPGLVA